VLMIQTGYRSPATVCATACHSFNDWVFDYECELLHCTRLRALRQQTVASRLSRMWSGRAYDGPASHVIPFSNCHFCLVYGLLLVTIIKSQVCYEERIPLDTKF
jgi:hypothetical protein